MDRWVVNGWMDGWMDGWMELGESVCRECVAF